MPAKYEKMRDEFISEGLSREQAKTKAAKIYNSQRKPGQKPVTGKHTGKHEAAKAKIVQGLMQRHKRG